MHRYQSILYSSGFFVTGLAFPFLFLCRRMRVLLLLGLCSFIYTLSVFFQYIVNKITLFKICFLSKHLYRPRIVCAWN